MPLCAGCIVIKFYTVSIVHQTFTSLKSLTGSWTILEELYVGP